MNYQHNLNYLTKKNIINTKILPYMADKVVYDIKPNDIRIWRNKMIKDAKKELSLTYVYSIEAQLTAILNYAVEYHDLPFNPYGNTKKIGKKNGAEKTIWTLDEYNRFIKTLEYDPVYYYAFQVLFWCGLRRGELLALTPSDIDFENKTITINKTYTRLKQADYITTPKTVNSNRVLTITDALAKNLKEYIEAIPNLEPTDRIFETINTHSLRRALDYTANAVGLKRIRVHDLRHSCCSLLFHLGCTPLEVKTYLGHKNIQITLNIYAHLYPEALDDVSKKIQAVEQRYQNGITDENE